MSYSDFTILLARQRSGTNPLRSILGTHRDVFCFNEVFNWGDRDADDRLLREANFFSFLNRYADGDVRRIFPDRHETIFRDFLEYLRCFTDKLHVIVDVKYNMTQFLTEPWTRDMTSPYLFDLIEKYQLRVLNLTRLNYLRYVLSTEKAWWSGRYTVTAGDADYRDQRKWLDPAWVVDEIVRCGAEDELIQRRFASYPRFRSFDYADVFPPRKPISPDFLTAISDWLGIANRFTTVSEYQRQASLPLEETIENYADVAAALRGTPYEYCLADEPAFRTRQRRTRKAPA
jgi:hypothetical protein